MAAFTWGANGAQMTPETAATLRAILARKKAQGTDTSPVGSWTQGLARVADAFVDKLDENRLSQYDANAMAQDDALLQGLGGETPAAYGLGNASVSVVPSPGAQSEISATSPSSPQQAPEQIGSLISELVPEQFREYATNLIGKESGFNPNAVSSTGATGLAQFTKGTGRQYGLINDAGDFRADPRANINALVRLTSDNYNGLKSALGREPSGAELALAHQQGIGGAIDLLSGRNVPGQNLSVNNVSANASPQQAASQIMSYYGNVPIGAAKNPLIDTSSISSPAVQAASAPYVAPPPPMTAPQNQPNAQMQQTTVDAGGNVVPVSAQASVAQPQAPQVAQSAQAPAIAAPTAPAISGPSGAQLAAAVKAINSPYASERTKSVAQAIIKQGQAVQSARQEQANLLYKQQLEEYNQSRDPLRQAQIQEANLRIEAANNPNRDLDARAKAAGLVPGSDAYKQFYLNGGKGPLVQVNTGDNSSKFNDKADEQAATRLNDIVAGGNSASQMLGDVQQLQDLGTQIQTGKGAQALLALGPYAEALGISIDGLGPSQAFDSIVSRLAPQMRPTGSGSSSDTDVKLFLKSLPSIGNTKEGNEIITSTLSALQQHKLAAAEIASKAFIRKEDGGISWQEAEGQIRKLPNPYQGFNEWRKGKDLSVPKQNQFPGAPAVGTVEGGYKYKGGDPANKTNWEQEM